MILQVPQNSHRRFLIDIDTQRDFLLPGGSACVRNHREVSAHIRSVMAWARREKILVISTAAVYPNNNGFSHVDYCLEGTAGQKKIRYTLLSNRVSFPAEDSDYLPVNLLQTHRQVILRKRGIDPFAEPRIDRLLSEAQADEFILIGAGAEGALDATALGLLRRGKTVRIVIDAVGSHGSAETKMGLRKMETKGARLTLTKTLVGI